MQNKKNVFRDSENEEKKVKSVTVGSESTERSYKITREKPVRITPSKARRTA